VRPCSSWSSSWPTTPVDADDVLGIERWLHLPKEQDVQSLFLSWQPLIRAANGYYAAVHLPLTGLALVWLFVRRRAFYHRTRNSLVVATLAVYLLLPVAPPRKLADQGFVDTALQLGQ
jgi:hypothetical protein